jgi:formate hydrogenlyase subunit 6/NADH:ubiquinone oxidoreductase subunit I
VRHQTVSVKHLYEGLDDCAAAAMLYGGDLSCEYGCLGYGNCVAACPHNALRMGPDELPVVDRDKCIGCGICVDVCPRGVLQLIPDDAPVVIRCRNHDPAKVVKNLCSAGCIACQICAKTCPHEAIFIEDNLAVVDYDICKRCEEPVCLVVKCKPKVILPNHGYIVPNIEPPKPRKKAPVRQPARDKQPAS